MSSLLLPLVMGAVVWDDSMDDFDSSGMCWIRFICGNGTDI